MKRSDSSLYLLALASLALYACGDDPVAPLPDSAPFDPRGEWIGQVDGRPMTLEITNVVEDPTVLRPRTFDGFWRWGEHNAPLLCAWLWTTDGSVECALFLPDFGPVDGIGAVNGICIPQAQGANGHEPGFDGYFDGERKLVVQMREVELRAFVEGEEPFCSGPVLLAFSGAEIAFVKQE